MRARLGAIREPWWVAAAALFSFIVTIWWITQDNQVPDFDEGMHLTDAIVAQTQIASGNLTAPFTDFNNYPPLVHIVGAIGFLIAGLHETAALLADNVFFLPMLAGGCYAAGAAAFNRRAGLLAAIFALSAPMWVSEMREFYVDPGEAAMVAATVGALLASRRFERVWVSALAGLLCTLGMLSKETFVLYVAGVVAVLILRGGWRNWRGLIAFFAVSSALTLPWYIYHYGQLAVLTQGATGSGGVASGNASAALGITPPRWSAANFAWYGWNLVNHELLVPMTLFFLAGTGVVLWRFARRRERDDLTPELVVGGLVGYLGVTYINLKDPRYGLPELVYLAVLATGWIATARPRPRRVLTAALALVCAVNFAMVSFGWGSPVSWTMPGPHGPTVAGARTLTFFSPNGYLHGGPVADGNLLGLIRGLKRMGFRYVEFDGGSANIPDFNQNGLGVLTIEAGLPEPPFGYNLALLTKRDAFVLRHFPTAGDPPPCQRMVDGSGVYVEVGNPTTAPFQEWTFVCPGRRPLFYHRTAPLPEFITHVLTGAPRRIMLGLFGALHRARITGVQFDSSMSTDYMEPIGLQALAVTRKLAVEPYDPAGNGPREAFMLRHVPVKGDPPPCVRMPDGSGVYIVLGNALVPFSQYRFFCPLRTPHSYR